MSYDKSIHLSEKPKSVKQNMVWNSAGSLIYYGLQWLITVLIVRLSSGYDAAGQLSLAMAIAQIFTPFALFRIRAFQISDVKGEYSTGEYVGFRIFTIGVSFVLITIYMFLTCDLSTIPVIFLYVVYKSIEVFIDVLHGLDQKKERMDYIGISLILRGFLSFISFCGVLFLFNNLAFAVLSMIVWTLLICIIYDWQKAKKLDALTPKINKALFISLSKRCFPAVIAAFFCIAAPSLPKQYLAYMCGDTALGIYSSINNPAIIIQVGATYIYSPLLVSFSKLFNTHKTREFQQQFVKVFLGILALSVFCAIIFLIFGKNLLVLFYGESIIPYEYLLQPALICTFFTALVWLLADLLIVVRNLKGNLLGNLAAFLITIPAGLYFINNFDMLGVSFSIIASYGIAIIVLVIFLLNSLRLKQNPGDSELIS